MPDKLSFEAKSIMTRMLGELTELKHFPYEMIEACYDTCIGMGYPAPKEGKDQICQAVGSYFNELVNGTKKNKSQEDGTPSGGD